MIVFATKIPVKAQMTEQNFIDLCAEWVLDSPHYHGLIIDYDVYSHKDYEISCDNITCQITCYKNDSAEITAFRLKNIDKASDIWTLDLLFICEDNKKYVSVQNNLDSNSYNPKIPHNHKPNFIKKLMEKDYGLKELNFEVKDSFSVCNSENLEVYAEFINGNINKELPMVYVSKDFDTYKVNYNKLSTWLSGMAYVVIEQDKATSLRLRELTNSKNAHNGYIGIYYPGSNNYQVYSPNDFECNSFESNIALTVQQSLINRMSSSEYNWIQIQAMKAKAKVIHSQNVSQELEDFISYADDNERELKKKIESLQLSNAVLTAQMEAIKAKNNDGGIHLTTDLQDFYIDEQYDFILNLLSEVKNQIRELNVGNFRRHEILNSILENNTQTGEGQRIAEELKRIFKPGFTWNATTKKKIKDLGFTIEENGHKKIVFHDNKYMYTVASTPGDTRGIKNLLSEIENGISITKKLL